MKDETKAPSVPLDAGCMMCGEYRPCVRVADIGWICLKCIEEFQAAARAMGGEQ